MTDALGRCGGVAGNGGESEAAACSFVSFVLETLPRQAGGGSSRWRFTVEQAGILTLEQGDFPVCSTVKRARFSCHNCFFKKHLRRGTRVRSFRADFFLRL